MADLSTQIRPRGPIGISRAAIGIGICCALVGTALRVSIDALLGRDFAPTAPFYPAVFLAALFGGVEAGAIAMSLSLAVIWWLVITPLLSPVNGQLGDLADLAIYSGALILIVWGGDYYRRLKIRAEAMAGESAALAKKFETLLEREEILSRELNHRTRNLITIVHIIAARSLSDGQPLSDARVIFLGRLEALAQTHAMLTETSCEGTALANIVRREFAAFSSRVSIDGCDIAVNANAAQQFALIVHELATNAVKYGALSTEDGQISIDGKVECTGGASVFSFRWSEKGGPPVFEPKRKGFGSTILLDVARQFGLHAALDYDVLGLRYGLDIPLSAIEVSQRQDARAGVPTPAVTSVPQPRRLGSRPRPF
jgi:two-component sensor histidine kinase